MFTYLICFLRVASQLVVVPEVEAEVEVEGDLKAAALLLTETFVTFDQSDDQANTDKDIDKDKYNDNDKDNDNDKYESYEGDVKAAALLLTLTSSEPLHNPLHLRKK